MTGLAYIKDSDARAYISAEWSTNILPPSIQEFLVDSGATKSSIDRDCAIGLTYRGAVRVATISGATQQYLLFSGGQLKFDVEDGDTGEVITVTHTGLWLLSSVKLIGVDIASANSLNVKIAYGAEPPTVQITK